MTSASVWVHSEGFTDLAFDGTAFIVTVCSGQAANTDLSIPPLDAPAFRKVLLSLLSADLDLLLLTAATELIRLECIFGLELRAAMLGNVAFSHPYDKVLKMSWSLSSGAKVKNAAQSAMQNSRAACHKVIKRSV